MRAMVFDGFNKPLMLKDIPCPSPEPGQLLLKVHACGVCRTDVHIVDGELSHPHLPLILGHQVVGTVEKIGDCATKHPIGSIVGVPWLGNCCRQCDYCLTGKENLCDQAVFTGYHCHGGFAEYCTVHEDFAVKIPSNYDYAHAAPLLCAGLIGYRAFRITNAKKTIGFYGFGSSAHILIQVANHLGYQVYVFTRPGDREKQQFALSLGAAWVGGADEIPPIQLDAVILFAPAGELYPQGLKVVKKGGSVVSAGIHMSDLPSFPYRLLWEERIMTSVANLTREDGREFMKLAEKIQIKVKITTYPLSEVNRAINDIRRGTIDGSAVLLI